MLQASIPRTNSYPKPPWSAWGWWGRWRCWCCIIKLTKINLISFALRVLVASNPYTACNIWDVFKFGQVKPKFDIIALFVTTVVTSDVNAIVHLGAAISSTSTLI